MNMNKLLILTALLGAGSFCRDIRAEVKLPQIISDGMVVQRDRPLTLTGHRRPGAKA